MYTFYTGTYARYEQLYLAGPHFFQIWALNEHSVTRQNNLTVWTNLTLSADMISSTICAPTRSLKVKYPKLGLILSNNNSKRSQMEVWYRVWYMCGCYGKDLNSEFQIFSKKNPKPKQIVVLDCDPPCKDSEDFHSLHLMWHKLTIITENSSFHLNSWHDIHF